MGNLDAMAASDAAIPYSDWGETVTYTPQDTSFVSFSCTVILGPTEVDAGNLGAVRDIRACTIRQSVLEAGGISSPTPQTSGRKGDALTIANAAGVDEDWTVSPDLGHEGGNIVQSTGPVFKKYAQEWSFVIERNVRLMP